MRKKIRWFEFFDSSKYVVSRVLAVEAVMLDKKHRIVKAVDRPGDAYFSITLIIIPRDDPQSTRHTSIIYDSHNNRWVWANHKKVVSWPSRYNLTKEDKSVIDKAVHEYVATVIDPEVSNA